MRMLLVDIPGDELESALALRMVVMVQVVR